MRVFFFLLFFEMKNKFKFENPLAKSFLPPRQAKHGTRSTSAFNSLKHGEGERERELQVLRRVSIESDEERDRGGREGEKREATTSNSLSWENRTRQSSLVSRLFGIACLRIADGGFAILRYLTNLPFNPRPEHRRAARGAGTRKFLTLLRYVNFVYL